MELKVLSLRLNKQNAQVVSHFEMSLANCQITKAAVQNAGSDVAENFFGRELVVVSESSVAAAAVLLLEDGQFGPQFPSSQHS